MLFPVSHIKLVIDDASLILLNISILQENVQADRVKMTAFVFITDLPATFAHVKMVIQEETVNTVSGKGNKLYSNLLQSFSHVW